MLKVSNKTKFKRKACGDFFAIRKKLVLCRKDIEKHFSTLYNIFLINEERVEKKVLNKC